MSTLSSEHTGNGNPTETSLDREDANAKIDDVLLNFEVLQTGFDRFIFSKKYIYVLVGLLLLGQLLTILLVISRPQTMMFLLELGLNLLPMVFIISSILLFNVWRKSPPKMLRELFEKKLISIPNSDANISYHQFLVNYRNKLRSPKRYILTCLTMIAFGILGIYGIVQAISVVYLNNFATILFVLGNLLSVLSYVGGLYCIGIEFWSACISGNYVRNLVHEFQLIIQPLHTDKCGGLKSLGDFCFSCITPLLFGFGLTIGYIIIYIISLGIRGNMNGTIFLALYLVIPLLFLFLYGVPIIVLAFILPLRDIHNKMVSEKETDEDTYNGSIETLRKKIQLLLDNDEVEEAKDFQEKKTILETLHAPYPTWPFSFRSKTFSSILNTIASILVGLITGVIPIIIPLIFHKP